jgi:ribosomal protein S18 acetylase RimI-like enzyme
MIMLKKAFTMWGCFLFAGMTRGGGACIGGVSVVWSGAIVSKSSEPVDSVAKWSIRQLRDGDAAALARFYNGLSEASRRTFRPLGWHTTVDACAKVVAGNRTEEKYDLVAVRDVGPSAEPEIIGWSFVWDLGSEKPNLGLGIADACQGQGLGGAMIDRVLGDVEELGLKQVYLIVVQDNHVARGLYERRGFVRYGECVGDDGLAYYQMVADLAE